MKGLKKTFKFKDRFKYKVTLLVFCQFLPSDF